MLSYFSRPSYSAFKSMLLASLLVVTTTAPAAIADDKDEWVLKVETEELKGQFQYKNTKVSPVAKVVIKYSRADKTNEPELFEYLWYHDGKPIGMERKGNFGLKRGELASIQVVPKNENAPLGKEESKAAANTLMRLGLLAYHNFTPLEAIIVPSDAFDEICDELRSHKCVDSTRQADEGSRGEVTFNMQSDNDSRAARLAYLRQR